VYPSLVGCRFLIVLCCHAKLKAGIHLPEDFIHYKCDFNDVFVGDRSFGPLAYALMEFSEKHVRTGVEMKVGFSEFENIFCAFTEIFFSGMKWYGQLSKRSRQARGGGFRYAP
jgi:hypothetical protein